MKRTLTQLIRNLACPVENSFQGPDVRMLFVCSVGMLRSPTAAEQAIMIGANARACGSCTDMALIPISLNLVLWADVIVFMNEENKEESLNNFFQNESVLEKLREGIVWDIPDNFARNDPKLIEIIKNKLELLA